MQEGYRIICQRYGLPGGRPTTSETRRIVESLIQIQAKRRVTEIDWRNVIESVTGIPYLRLDEAEDTSDLDALLTLMRMELQIQEIGESL